LAPHPRKAACGRGGGGRKRNEPAYRKIFSSLFYAPPSVRKRRKKREGKKAAPVPPLPVYRLARDDGSKAIMREREGRDAR